MRRQFAAAMLGTEQRSPTAGGSLMMPPNNAFERSAGSHSLAAAAQRGS